MAIAAISDNPKSAARYLKKTPVNSNRKGKYIFLGEKDIDAVNLLEERGFQEIHFPKHNKSYRDRFLQEYIDAIGTLGNEGNARKWWATDIASKNRFASHLSSLLYQFMIAMEAAKKEDCDHLIVFSSSWVLFDALKEALEENGLRVVHIEDHFRKWIGMVRIWWRMVVLSVYNALLAFTRKRYVQKELGRMIDTLSRDKAFYVIKTFIYDSSFPEKGLYRDAFFGSLLEFLQRRREVLIYANILGDYRSCVRKIAQCAAPAIVPIEGLLSYMDILKTLVESLFCRIRFKKEVCFFGCNVSRLVNNELFRTYNGMAFYQLLHYWSTKRLFQTVPIETFLLTYENNPWEKMCMIALKEQAPDTTVIGYQHTVVPQASANMFMSRKEQGIMPVPDRILTVGEVPREIMERYGHFRNGQIEASCGLRFEYLSQTSIRKRRGTRNVLVVLEGIFEAYKMVNYVLRELKGKARYEVTIRTHPVLPLNHFEHKLTYDARNTVNFHISSNISLREDIGWSDLVIYWGSTVALEALSMGKPIIHYEMDSILSYDPLFECSHLKWVVSEEDPLIPILQEIDSLTDEHFTREQGHAKAYLDRYFLAVTEQRLHKFLPQAKQVGS